MTESLDLGQLLTDTPSLVTNLSSACGKHVRKCWYVAVFASPCCAHRLQDQTKLLAQQLLTG
jgi:hypothetical protein